MYVHHSINVEQRNWSWVYNATIQQSSNGGQKTGPNQSLNCKKTTVDRSSSVQSGILQIANLGRLVLVSVYACQGKKTRPDQTFKH